MPLGALRRKPSPGAPRQALNPHCLPTDPIEKCWSRKSMLKRRDIVIGAICAAIAVPARADATALAFVNEIYGAYKGKNAKGIPLDGDVALRRYFEPSLAALISKDQKDAARQHAAPNLDGDPFVDAQDWEISNFDIAVNDTSAGKATATVKFVNQGNAATVVLDLVTVNNAWRINDITWTHDGKPETLRGLYVTNKN
jgi:Protein of unknown function (DUF3828)